MKMTQKDCEIMGQIVKPSFENRLSINLDLLKERIYKKKKASLIIIDGYQGEGKSTLAVQCGDYYQQKEIDLESQEQYAVGGKQFQEKFDICIEKGHQVIIYDKAGDFDKYSSYTDFNKAMSQFFRTFRTYKIFIILVLPNFNDLDTRLYKNGVPRLLLHCHGKNEKVGRFKAYGLWRMEHLRLKLKMFDQKMLPQEVYKSVRPNFKGKFYDLSPERAKLLDRISTEGKSDIRTQTRIKQDGLITIRDIATNLSRSILWVKKKVNEKDITPKMVYKRTHYFEQSIINTLEKEKKK
jgi:hypothetical protein